MAIQSVHPLCKACVGDGRTTCWYKEAKSALSSMLFDAINSPKAQEGDKKKLSDTRAGTDDMLRRTAVERGCTRVARKNVLREN